MTLYEKIKWVQDKGISIKFLSNLTEIKQSMLYKIRENYNPLQKNQTLILEQNLDLLINLYNTSPKATPTIRYKDLSNQRFGKLVALYPIKPNSNGSMLWACQCDCGNPQLKITSANSLQQGDTTSCGCKYSINGGHNFKDLTGLTFGQLTVLYRGPNSSDNRVQWQCKCSCGNKTLVRSHDLLEEKTLSCGCLSKSVGETNIEKILQENNITYEKEYSFSDLFSPKGKPLRFDFAIFTNDKLSHLIEFDGQQHNDNLLHFNESVEERKYRLNLDKIKNEYVKNHQIPLIRIPYIKRNSITIQDILL